MVAKRSIEGKRRKDVIIHNIEIYVSSYHEEVTMLSVEMKNGSLPYT